VAAWAWGIGSGRWLHPPPFTTLPPAIIRTPGAQAWSGLAEAGGPPASATPGHTSPAGAPALMVAAN